MNLSDSNRPDEMSEETPAALLAEHGESLETLLAAVAGPAVELKEAIEDLPAQVENLARVTLARAFIYRRADGSGFDFDEAAFSRAWAAIAGNEGGN